MNFGWREVGLGTCIAGMVLLPVSLAVDAAVGVQVSGLMILGGIVEYAYGRSKADKAGPRS